jgi:drug/metabolite transporter (DMT)-like permease
MEFAVFVAVLAAACCHAGWNALAKGRGDPLLTTAVVSIAAGVVGIAMLAVVGLPRAAAWPWIAASVATHIFYFASLIEAYRHGDLGQVYPIARGSAPLLTAAASIFAVGENLNVTGWGGLVLLAAGVLLLALRGGREFAHFNPRGVAFALGTGVTICAYTVVDGIGARVSGAPATYTAALFVGSGLVMLIYALARLGAPMLVRALPLWRLGVVGGALQFASYGIAIWAMTVAPLALVAALRETSVLFGAVIGVLWLKEPLSILRIVAGATVAVGLILLRLA